MTLISLLVFVLVVWLLLYLAGMLGDPKVVRVVQIVIVVIAIVYLLEALGFIAGLGAIRIGRY